MKFSEIMLALKYVGITILAIIAVIIIAGYFLFSGVCENSIFDEVISPDSKLKIVVFERDCGATTGFSTQVSIIESYDELDNEAGNIYIGEEKRNGYVVKWLSNSHIKIYGTRERHFKKLRKFRSVNIVYQ